MLIHFAVKDMYVGSTHHIDVVVKGTTAFSTAVTRAKTATGTIKTVQACLAGGAGRVAWVPAADWGITFAGLLHRQGFDAEAKGNFVELVAYGSTYGG